MSAQFLLTFDCEGRWGVADRLTTRNCRDLADEPIHDAYHSIVGLLDEYRIPATFAFVGAFAQSAADFSRLRPEIESLKTAVPAYLGPALRNLDESRGDGWHGSNILDMVTGARSPHEIALHGVTHVPWTSMDEHAVEMEMAIFNSLLGPVRSSRTFVYPRNLVAHAGVLERHGFAGYRVARAPRTRLRSFLSEFNVFERPERPLQSNGIVRIPAGFFLNWRSGIRALVPAAVTRTRARRLLQATAETGDVVHFWLHPENIASAPSTLALLRALVHEVAVARDSGQCDVMTQFGYCRARESLT